MVQIIDQLIDQHIGEEIFLVCDGEDTDICELHFLESWGELLEYLKTLSPKLDAETRVFHGVLTLANVLPSSLHGKDAFIICLDPFDISKGCVTESDSDDVEGISEEIKEIVRKHGPLPEVKIDIDDILILYGYQIDTCLSINDEEIDEETINTCKEISDEIEAARIMSDCMGG